jgi:hypothetical protein
VGSRDEYLAVAVVFRRLEDAADAEDVQHVRAFSLVALDHGEVRCGLRWGGVVGEMPQDVNELPTDVQVGIGGPAAGRPGELDHVECHVTYVVTSHAAPLKAFKVQDVQVLLGTGIVSTDFAAQVDGMRVQSSRHRGIGVFGEQAGDCVRAHG